jgi:hypothetical protein
MECLRTLVRSSLTCLQERSTENSSSTLDTLRGLVPCSINYQVHQCNVARVHNLAVYSA